MIWLTWRQFRAHAVTVSALLATVAVALAITGPRLRHLPQAEAVPPADSVLFYVGAVLVYLLPALIGAFWGAPLIARELETGTHRLAWNQGVTRTRWLATKLAVVGLAAMAASGLLSLAVTWWARPLDTVAGMTDANTWWADVTAHPIGMKDADFTSRVDPLLFGARGIAPIGHAAFAFVLGVAAGAVIRRTVAAMVVTLAVFAAVQIAVPAAVRPHLLTPDQQIVPITPDTIQSFNIDGPHLTVAGPPGAWVLSNHTVDTGGRTVGNLPSWARDCPPPPPMPGQPAETRRRESATKACFAKLADLGYRQRVTYQPVGRFWALQWAETALFLVFSALLAGLCFWWTRHRLP